MCVQCVLRYTITWLQCAFSLVVDRDLLKDTHTDGFKSTSAVLFFFFHAPKTFNLTGDQKVAGSIPVWGSETFFWVCDKAWVYSKQFSFNLPSCKSTSYVYIYITFILLFVLFTLTSSVIITVDNHARKNVIYLLPIKYLPIGK